MIKQSSKETILALISSVIAQAINLSNYEKLATPETPEKS